MEPVNIPPISATPTPSYEDTSPKSNKKTLILVIGGVILLFIISVFLIIFLSANKKSAVENLQNGNSPLITNTPNQNKNRQSQPTPASDDDNFENSSIKKDSFEIFPGVVTGRAKMVIPSEFTMQSTPGDNGSTKIKLISSSPDIILPEFNLTANQKLLMIAPLLNQQIPDTDLGDIYFVVVDGNGKIVK